MLIPPRSTITASPPLRLARLRNHCRTRMEAQTFYFGTKAPEGKAGNWLPTTPGRAYMAVLRLYFPTEAAIDKRWKPGDFEIVN